MKPSKAELLRRIEQLEVHVATLLKCTQPLSPATVPFQDGKPFVGTSTLKARTGAKIGGLGLDELHD